MLIIDSLFLMCPLAELPLLDKSARLDLIDYYHAGLPARATNTMGGVTTILEHTERSITLQLTSVSRWQLTVTDNGTLRCDHTLTPADLPERTSTRFYSSDWLLKR